MDSSTNVHGPSHHQATARSLTSGSLAVAPGTVASDVTRNVTALPLRSAVGWRNWVCQPRSCTVGKRNRLSTISQSTSGILNDLCWRREWDSQNGVSRTVKTGRKVCLTLSDQWLLGLQLFLLLAVIFFLLPSLPARCHSE